MSLHTTTVRKGEGPLTHKKGKRHQGCLLSSFSSLVLAPVLLDSRLYAAFRGQQEPEITFMVMLTLWNNIGRHKRHA